MVPPAGVRRARWVIVRRKEDGQLFFAPSTWKDEQVVTSDEGGYRLITSRNPDDLDAFNEALVAAFAEA